MPLVVVGAGPAGLAGLAGCSARVLAKHRAERDRVNVLRPDVPFDAAAAVAALEPGTAAIAGVAFHKVRTSPLQLFNVKTVFAGDEKVVLRPARPRHATPHVLAWLRLRVNEVDARTRVEFAAAAEPVARTTRTDACGRFRFEGLRPGGDHLQSGAHRSEVVTGRAAVGSVVHGWGASRTVPRHPVSAVNPTQRLSPLVGIAEDGEVVEVDLRK